MAERGLRKIELRRRPGETSLPRDHQEGQEIIDVLSRHS
jgi:hypothetical protein